jgi:16S rRNA (cytidine1402-2'-O)-methyltransferase
MPTQQTSTLYLVATPIGNLEDITLRALRVLSEVSLIAAEDTRTVRKLLSRHGIRQKRIMSYTERNRRARIPAILAALRARQRSATRAYIWSKPPLLQATVSSRCPDRLP